MKTIQYTIRSIPPKLDTKLRTNAQRKGLSLNSYVLQELTHSVSNPTNKHSENNFFSNFLGKWSSEEAQEFDKSIKSIRVVDKELWR